MSIVATALGAPEIAAQGLRNLPPFSPVLNRLLATLSRENISFAKISELIERDPVLAGNVLSLVNSALYARSGRINSVRHAVSLLGVNKLRNATLGMSIARMWSKVQMPPGWSMDKFNQHSIASAILADLLAQESAVIYPEGAFVAGLLHDLGLLLLAIAKLPVAEEVTAAEVSAEALACWNLPDEIQTAVRFQDNPDSDPSKKPGTLCLSHLVNSADIYVNSIGAIIPYVAARPQLEDPFTRLNIDLKIPRILEEFHQEYEAIRAVL